MRDQSGMWLHYCNVDHCWYSVGVAEECTWCGCKEEDEPVPILTLAPPLQASLGFNLRTQSRTRDLG